MLKIMIASSVSLVVLLTLLMINSANAQVSDKVYAADSKPFGLTYGQWSEKWWQWSLSIPLVDNPGGDDTGEKCGEGQSDTNVWYLSGTFGGPAVRNCNMPEGKAIFFPVINSECSYLEFPAYKTEPELRKCAVTFTDKVSNLDASVDGIKIPDIRKYRFQSGLFNFSMPADNVLGLAPGITDSVADGYWIMLKPLAKGEHTIQFGGSVVDVSITSSINFATQATYHITVQ
jgi:hypothetical protein